ncbi:MAG: class C sortase [Lachnospiraceae bacterium]|nr:class C sortase [Lachnospiraceae bacterium]
MGMQEEILDKKEMGEKDADVSVETETGKRGRGKRRKGKRGLDGRSHRIARILGALFFLFLGVGLLAYPWISNWLYENQTYSTYSAYSEELAELGSEELANQLAAAQEYNETLKIQQPTITNPFNSTALETLGDDAYWNLLCTGDSGVMAYLEIPAISVYLPVFHGTEDTTLSAGIGHLEGSSLPVGGESTHAVLTGHSGLTGKKLFTDLSELEEGDYFFVHVLGETLAYRVCVVQAVLPDDLNTLRIEEGKDLVTLMTCTPYGINSHRLLVTGERVEYTEEMQETSEVKKITSVSRQWVKDYERAALTAVIVLIMIVIGRAVRKNIKRRWSLKAEKIG